jgi:hypothetical protein
MRSGCSASPGQPCVSLDSCKTPVTLYDMKSLSDRCLTGFRRSSSRARFARAARAYWRVYARLGDREKDVSELQLRGCFPFAWGQLACPARVYFQQVRPRERRAQCSWSGQQRLVNNRTPTYQYKLFCADRVFSVGTSSTVPGLGFGPGDTNMLQTRGIFEIEVLFQPPISATSRRRLV